MIITRASSDWPSRSAGDQKKTGEGKVESVVHGQKVGCRDKLGKPDKTSQKRKASLHEKL